MQSVAEIMTKEEASKKYNIPIEILDEYEKWGLCKAVKEVMGKWHYDDTDIEKLSLIMTLHYIGFNSDEVETYMNLVLNNKTEGAKENGEQIQLQMLNDKRNKLLDEIHFKEKHLARLDYLRYEINKNCTKKKTRKALFSKYV